MTAGFLFIIIGAGMATLGFYSDYLSKVEETRGNTTVWVKNESKDSHLGSLTYFGPVVMGIEVLQLGGSGSTPSVRSSKASWERFLSHQRSSEDAEDTRTAVTQELVNFSKYLQNNVDTNKIQLQPASSNQQITGIP
ncbi:uncharacterized protein CEXT_701401 [Caerostris extrusa]|uniref:Uncharacterized protein n=1 Tax=Caerostris extrusa TaxID=172846 RepID=A0AAV4VUI1_CAEEX|nr:uncharacterized protein CEXT_701401 [Caerostris extrusa]